jgi:inner membrane protein
MNGHTHTIIGATAGLGIATITSTEPALLVAAGAAAGLLPDIDHPSGSIRQRLGIVGHIGLFWLSHRGITHTIAALLLVGAIAWYVVPGPLAMAIVAGYASHLLADLLTIAGLPVLLPLTERRFYLLPRLMRIKTGSIIETVIMLGGVAGSAYLWAISSNLI